MTNPIAPFLIVQQNLLNNPVDDINNLSDLWLICSLYLDLTDPVSDMTNNINYPILLIRVIV